MVRPLIVGNLHTEFRNKGVLHGALFSKAYGTVWAPPPSVSRLEGISQLLGIQIAPRSAQAPVKLRILLNVQDELNIRIQTLVSGIPIVLGLWTK